MIELASQGPYAEVQPGERVEVVHVVHLGLRQGTSRTLGTVVTRARQEGGSDSGHRRAPDERQFFDQLLLRKDDGELSWLTLDEFTTVRRLG